jgi:hypothetical protein
MLGAKFTLEEIRTTMFQMKRNKAPCPNGLLIEFYQHFWPLVCNDLYGPFQYLYNEEVDISRFNYGILTLLPKRARADMIQHYIPIHLLNGLLKILLR